MASINSAEAIRETLSHTGFGRLPHEIKDLIEDQVPVLHIANEVGRLRARPRHRFTAITQTPPAGDPTIPPTDGSSPFLKLPVELRRNIFINYLLPSKAQSIEPTQFVKRRDAFLKKRRSAEQAIRRTRNLAQQNTQNGHLGLAHWNAQLNQQAHPVPFAPLMPPALAHAPAIVPPQQPVQSAHITVQAPQTWVNVPAAPNHVPPVQNAAAHATFQGAPPMTSNPLTWTGNPILNPPNLVAPPNQPVPLPPALATYQAHVNALMAGAPAGNLVPVTYYPLPQTLPDLQTPAEAMLAEQQENKRRLEQLRRYDDNPERIITALLRINSELCIEISTILYEEFTFQVHIHSDGVELLGFDRIPTLENWGVEIEETMGAFKSEKHFCFHRMKHLEFIYFGGDPSDRLAGLRMRESTRKLVDMLKNEGQGLSSVVVRYTYEKVDEGQEYGLHNAITDGLGSFWSTGENNQEKGVLGQNSRDPRSSIMHNVYNVQLVCAPLSMLHNVSKTEMQFPEEIIGNLQLTETAAHMAKMMSGTSLRPETLDELMREEMMMDARRDKELLLAGAGGYYKPKRKGGEDDLWERGLLALEEEMEEDELVAPFGGGEVGYEKVYGSLQELADHFDMGEADDDELQASGADGIVKDSDKGLNRRRQ